MDINKKIEARISEVEKWKEQAMEGYKSHLGNSEIESQCSALNLAYGMELSFLREILAALQPSPLPLIEKENRDPLSLEMIIAYMERTKEEDWLLDKVRSKDGDKHCFFSHLFNMGGSFLWEIFEEMYATTYMIYPVNDGKNEKYQQSTAKERVIAYLKDLRDGKEQTTHQMMEEEYATFKNKKQ